MPGGWEDDKEEAAEKANAEGDSVQNLAGLAGWLRVVAGDDVLVPEGDG